MDIASPMPLIGICLFLFGFLFLLLSDVLEQFVVFATVLIVADQTVNDEEQHDNSCRHEHRAGQI